MLKKKNFKENIITVFFIFLSAIMVIPMLMLIGTSFSNEKDIVEYGYAIIPRNIDLSAYTYLLKNPKQLIDAYKVTIIFTAVSMVLSVLLMSMTAYALARDGFKGKKFVSFYLYFTTLFGGGLVPSYILITQYLHLQDTIWVYIIPSLIVPTYIFMIRTNFQALPKELTESALIDGAGEYTIFFKIILPLSKPVLATIALFTFLAKWNDWGTSMLYINNREDLISLQYLLQRLLMNIELLRDTSISQYTMNIEIPAETVRMAMAVVAAGPVLVIFPFFQKYFTKGMTVGSVKG
ncbi:MAG: carbohydrate ABC transporter permease [Clostridia bacterium]|nr:carbohydrate ABC transporter permease [Clostridia bacterium]